MTFDESIGCFNNAMINVAAVYIYFALSFGLKYLNEITIKKLNSPWGTGQWGSLTKYYKRSGFNHSTSGHGPV